MDNRITIYGSFTSSSSYKPMLFLTLARLPFSFRTVNLKTGLTKFTDDYDEFLEFKDEYQEYCDTQSDRC